MVSEPTNQANSASRPSSSSADRTSISVTNVVIGGIAGIFLGFIPLSPVLGGAITGYLGDGPTDQSVKAGALAGVIMLIPFFFLGVLYLLLILGIGEAGVALGIVGLVVFVVGGLYTVGLSALGGYLGAYLREER